MKLPLGKFALSIIALADVASANVRCAGVLARNYAAAGYTEVAVAALWATAAAPDSREIEVLIDTLEDAATTTTNARARASRLALAVEADGGPAFADEITPERQRTALRDDPRGAELLAAWRAVGWELSPQLETRGYGLVVRNGMPRELHVPWWALPRRMPRAIRNPRGVVDLVSYDIAEVGGLLARFPTVRRLVGLSEERALWHFAYVACFGHPGGVLEVERMLNERTSFEVDTVLDAVFSWWREQPQKLPGPSGVSWSMLQAIEKTPGVGPRLAAWIRGEPALPEDFFGPNAVAPHFAHVSGLNDTWVSERFDAVYAAQPPARQAAMRVRIGGYAWDTALHVFGNSEHRDVRRVVATHRDRP